MKKITLKTILLLSACPLLASCSPSRRNAGPSGEAAATEAVPVGALVRGSSPAFIPMATAFRMNGDYESHVAVNVNTEGVLTYFPAPSDISASSAPVAVGNGWWINRQGFGPDARFLRYTFKEYAVLQATPSPSLILESVIPGARVTQFVKLPWNIYEIGDNMAECKAYLNSNYK